MDFSGFAASRDLLYVSGAVTGIAAGFLLSLLRKSAGLRVRNRRIALALLFFSGTVAGAAVSFIISMGRIFSDTSVVITAVVCMAVCIPAVLFPRAAAWPLFILCGAAAAWLAIFCLRFPVSGAGPALIISHTGDSAAADAYRIEYAPAAHKSVSYNAVYRGRDTDNAIIQINGARSFLNITIARIDIGQNIPFSGGARHFLVTKIESDAGLEYSDNSLDAPLARIGYTHSPPGVHPLRIGIDYLGNTLNPDDIARGNQIPVYIDSFDRINQN